MHENKSPAIAKEAKQFLSIIWEQKGYNRNAAWINNMEKELQGLEEGPEANISLESLRATLKKVLHWKQLGYDSIHRF